MTSLIRGENTTLPTAPLTVDVAGVASGTVDLLIFHLDATGRVRGDDDLIFYKESGANHGRQSPARRAISVGGRVECGGGGGHGVEGGLGVDGQAGRAGVPALGHRERQLRTGLRQMVQPRMPGERVEIAPVRVDGPALV